MREELPGPGGAQHPPPASPQRSGMGLQRDVPHPATGRVTRQLLLLLEHPKGRDPSASSSRAPPGFAMPTLRWGTEAPKDAWKHRGKTSMSQGLRDCSGGGVPWGQPLPACPSGGDKPGASPSDKGRWDCSPAVPGQHPQCGSWGPPGTSLTLKPSRAHMSRQPVTTTSCYSRLERERQRKAETTGLGAGKITYYSQKWAWGYF